MHKYRLYFTCILTLQVVAKERIAPYRKDVLIRSGKVRQCLLKLAYTYSNCLTDRWWWGYQSQEKAAGEAEGRQEARQDGRQGRDRTRGILGRVTAMS